MQETRGLPPLCVSGGSILSYFGPSFEVKQAPRLWGRFLGLKSMTDNPLTKLGDLTKPATVLIEKISDAVGGVFKPYQIVRVAKADAEANRIQAESRIQVTDLHRRAMHRFLEEEATKQSNIEAITQNALPLLEDKSAPQNVADDWTSSATTP